MSVSLLPVPKIQFLDSNGKPYSGGQLYTYSPGTTTLATTYTDSTGLVPNANPVILDSAGRASVWISGFIKVALYDMNSVLVYTQDNISSMPNTVFTTNQFIAQSLVATYISASQFSVPTNLTASFQVGRRLQAVVSAGTITGTISDSSSGGSPVITTVTSLWDTGQLDAGLSAVSLALLTPLTPSVPILPPNIQTANYAMVGTDINKLIEFNSANATTFTPMAANAVPAGSAVPIKNIGAGVLTINANVDGVANATLSRYAALNIASDGNAWRNNSGMFDKNMNQLFAVGNPNSNASSNAANTTISNIAVTNGDILAVQAQTIFQSNANQAGSVTITTAGATAVSLPGFAPLLSLMHVVGQAGYEPLFSIYFITQTGNLSLTSSIVNGSPINITNAIGYAFLKKQ